MFLDEKRFAEPQEPPLYARTCLSDAIGWLGFLVGGMIMFTSLFVLQYAEEVVGGALFVYALAILYNSCCRAILLYAMRAYD